MAPQHAGYHMVSKRQSDKKEVQGVAKTSVSGGKRETEKNSRQGEERVYAGRTDCTVAREGGNRVLRRKCLFT